MSAESSSVLVFGGPRTGKTLNRDAIKAYFGCDHIWDEPSRFELARLLPGKTLILSSYRDLVMEARGKPACVFVPDVECRVAHVSRWLGEKWIAPIMNFDQPEPHHVKPTNSQGDAEASPSHGKDATMAALLNALQYARDGIVKMADHCDMEAVEETGLDVQDCRDCVELAIERAGGVV